MRGYLLWFGLTSTATFAAVWLFAAFCPATYMPDTYLHEHVQLRQIATCELGQVAIFGDSQAKAAIVPRLLSVPTINLALAGTSPVETYFAVARAMQCPKVPRWVIIAHGARAFDRHIGFWTQDSNEGFLSPNERNEVERAASRLDDEGTIAPPNDGLTGSIRDWLYTVWFPPLHFANLLDSGLGILRYGHNRAVLRQVARSGGHALYGNGSGTNGVDTGYAVSDFEVRPLIDLYFDKTLNLLQKRGVVAIFLVVPVNQSTHDAASVKALGQFAEYLQEKSEKYPGFHVATGPMPCLPNENFSTPAHMNAKGSALYSAQVDRLLRGVEAGTIAGMRDGPLQGGCD